MSAALCAVLAFGVGDDAWAEGSVADLSHDNALAWAAVTDALPLLMLGSADMFAGGGTAAPGSYDLDVYFNSQWIELVPGFGVTTQIINGGVECGGSEESAQSLNCIK